MGKYLSKCRENAGIGKNQMCRDADIAFSQLQDIELGKRNYGIDNLISYIMVVKKRDPAVLKVLEML